MFEYENPDHLYFMWGKFNPVHKGHMKVFEFMRESAAMLSCPKMVFSPFSKDIPKIEKIAILTDVFGKSMLVQKFADVANYISDNYKSATLVAGSDRVDDFKRMLDSYSKELGIEFDVVSGGLRGEQDKISALTSTQMRRWAIEGDYDSFYGGLPDKMSKMHQYSEYQRFNNP